MVVVQLPLVDQEVAGVVLTKRDSMVAQRMAVQEEMEKHLLFQAPLRPMLAVVVAQAQTQIPAGVQVVQVERAAGVLA
jgi:hypothetical protein